MKSDFIFCDSQGSYYCQNDIVKKLREIGASDCEKLFIHTDVGFGVPNKELKRKGYFESLYQSLLALGVPTLMFPSFTYSFCNGEDYNVRESKTSMGALIEYIRMKPEVVRSLDPLLSFIAVGKDTNCVFGDTGHHSLGAGSGFDHLHHTDGVKFLFFGADFAEYFTYVHYVEKMLEVPYRFDKAFSGNIIDYDGNVRFDEHFIHTQCGGVELRNYAELKNELLGRGIIKAVRLGDRELACISEKDAYREISEHIRKNPFYNLKHPYSQGDLTKIYTFGLNGERVTHC